MPLRQLLPLPYPLIQPGTAAAPHGLLLFHKADHADAGRSTFVRNDDIALGVDVTLGHAVENAVRIHGRYPAVFGNVFMHWHTTTTRAEKVVRR